MNEKNKQIADGDNIKQALRDINETTIYNITENSEYLQKKLPSYLAKVIYRLNKLIENEARANDDCQIPYEINEKIVYNNVGVYKVFIENYGNYGSIVDKIYDEIDNEKPNSKKKFLENIKNRYLRILSYFVGINNGKNLLEVVRENADEIMKRVYDELLLAYKTSYNALDLTIEDLDICVIIIVCKAFIDCKILEAPKK